MPFSNIKNFMNSITFLIIWAFFLLMMVLFDYSSTQYYLNQKSDSHKYKIIQSNADRLIFKEKNLSQYNFNKHKFHKANLTNKYLYKSNLEDADLSSTKLINANLTQCNLKNADLRKADLTGANLFNANLSGAKLSGAIFKNTNLVNANLSNAKLTGVDLTKVILKKNKVQFGRDVNTGILYGIINLKFFYDRNQVTFQHSDLSDANLSGLDLSGLNLKYTNLSGANLSRANLAEANLSFINVKKPLDIFDSDKTILSIVKIYIDDIIEKIKIALVKQYVSGENRILFSIAEKIVNKIFTKKEQDSYKKKIIEMKTKETTKHQSTNIIKKIHFNNVNFTNANMAGADLTGSDLKKSILTGVNFSGATLVNIDISGIDLSNINIADSNFQPIKLDVGKAVGIKGLANINKDNINLDNVIKWRKQANEYGFRGIERDCISILKRFQLDKEPNIINYIFEKFVLGGYFTDYGANPLGIFRYFIYSLIFFTFIYYIWMSPKNQKYGILKITKDGDNKENAVFLQRNWIDAFWFSLLSATHIGYGDIQPGSWLPRLQLDEYTLKGKGRVRFAAGFQSLLSVYIIVVLITTYFKNPFA